MDQIQSGLLDKRNSWKQIPLQPNWKWKEMFDARTCQCVHLYMDYRCSWQVSALDMSSSTSMPVSFVCATCDKGLSANIQCGPRILGVLPVGWSPPPCCTVDCCTWSGKLWKMRRLYWFGCHVFCCTLFNKLVLVQLICLWWISFSWLLGNLTTLQQ